MELVFTVVFTFIGDVRSSTILMDKHNFFLIAISEVISKDVHCWRVENKQKTQASENASLCHFHVIKAWSKKFFFSCCSY